VGYLNDAANTLNNPNAVTNPTGVNTPSVNTDISKPSTLSSQSTVQAQSYVQDLNPKALAANQLKEFTAKDSPLMQRAREQGTRYAAGRGFTQGSSIAAGASMGAMVDRATPIVLQDAQSEFARQSENLAAQNRTSMFNAEQENLRIRQADSLMQDIARLEKEGSIKSNLQAQALREDLQRLQEQGGIDLTKIGESGFQDRLTQERRMELERLGDQMSAAQRFEYDRIIAQEGSQLRREETILAEKLLGERSQQDFIREIAKLDAEVGREAAITQMRAQADAFLQQMRDANADKMNRNQMYGRSMDNYQQTLNSILTSDMGPAEQAAAIARAQEGLQGYHQILDAMGGATPITATPPATPDINLPRQQQLAQARSEIARLFQTINTDTGANEAGVAAQIDRIARDAGMSPEDVDAAAGAPLGTTRRYRAEQGWAE
jgi:hypothetical protein